jgi:hypothetical protein
LRVISAEKEPQDYQEGNKVTLPATPIVQVIGYSAKDKAKAAKEQPCLISGLALLWN